MLLLLQNSKNEKTKFPRKNGPGLYAKFKKSKTEISKDF